MKSTGIILAAGLALATGACTQDNYGPYYGPSQGYVYPSPGYGYYGPSPGYGYYGARPYYRPARYGYRDPYSSYGGYGPSITFTLPAGNLP
jgi:hypothetical protein